MTGRDQRPVCNMVLAQCVSAYGLHFTLRVLDGGSLTRSKVSAQTIDLIQLPLTTFSTLAGLIGKRKNLFRNKGYTQLKVLESDRAESDMKTLQLPRHANSAGATRDLQVTIAV